MKEPNNNHDEYDFCSKNIANKIVLTVFFVRYIHYLHLNAFNNGKIEIHMTAAIMTVTPATKCSSASDLGFKHNFGAHCINTTNPGHPSSTFQ